MPSMKYKESVEILSTFFRNQATRVQAAQVPGAAGALFTAIANQRGDFAPRFRSSFTGCDDEISKAVWYVKAENRNAEVLEPPPAFSFNDIMSALGMLSFTIPHAGSIVAAGLGAFQAAINNLETRTQWWKRLREANNTPMSPYQQVVDQVVKHIDDKAIKNEVNILFAQIASIQQSLNKVLPDPKDAVSASSGVIRTSSSLTKTYALGDQGIGQVFKLLKSPDFKKLANDQGAWARDPIQLGLASNPTYAEATATALLHASVTIVNALLAYAFLYVLPDDAFTDPDWDNSKFNIEDEIKKSGKKSIQGLKSTAWDALQTLTDILDPEAEISLTARIAHIPQMWNRIFDRLKKVEFACNQSQQRNNLTYAGGDQTLQLSPPLNQPLNFNSIVTAFCGTNQVVCWDRTLNSPVRDSFIEPYRKFQNTIRINWSISSNAGDIASYVFTAGGVAIAQAIKVQTLNTHWGSFTYPIATQLTAAKPEKASGYEDLFWTYDFGFNGTTAEDLIKDLATSFHRSAHPQAAAFSDASKPGFLSTQQGRDIVAWLSVILVQYCTEYRFNVDISNDTNTLDVSESTFEILKATREVAKQLIS